MESTDAVYRFDSYWISSILIRNGHLELNRSDQTTISLTMATGILSDMGQTGVDPSCPCTGAER